MGCRTAGRGFPALVNGMQLTCAISGQILQQRFGAEGPAQWLAAFQEHRWDLEEEAEALIRDGQEDAQGWIWYPDPGTHFSISHSYLLNT